MIDPYNLTKEEFTENDMSYGMYKEAFMITNHASDPVYTQAGTPLWIAMGGEEEVEHPHIHVFKSEEDHINWRYGSCISLITNGIVDDGIHNESLTRDEFDTVVSYIINGPISYKDLCGHWNVYNADEHIGTLILPIQGDNPPKYDYDTASKIQVIVHKEFI